MANRFWVGGTGTWDGASTTNWSATSGGGSGASVPTAADSVIFDANSNTGTGAFTVTISGTRVCLDFTATAIDGTMTFNGTATPILNLSGSWASHATLFVIDPTITTIRFNSTTTGKTVQFNGYTLPSTVSLIFNGIGGGWTLSSNLTTLGSVNPVGGAFSLGNFALTASSIVGNSTNTRSIDFGSTGTITLTGDNAVLWNFPDLTSFSFTGTLLVTANLSSAANNRSFIHGTTAGATEANALSVSVTAGGGSAVLTGSFKNVNTTGSTASLGSNPRTIYGNLTLGSGTSTGAAASVTTFGGTSTQLITTNGVTINFPIVFDGIGGTFQLQDALTQLSTQTTTFTNGTLQLKSGVTSTVGTFVTSGTALKYLQSTTAGTRATLSQASGTVTVTYLNIKDSAATGGAIWDATSATNVNGGNSPGWAFPITLTIGQGFVVGPGFVLGV